MDAPNPCLETGSIVYAKRYGYCKPSFTNSYASIKTIRLFRVDCP